MPRWCPLRLHLRGRVGALLFATARVSWHSSGAIHSRRYSPRVCDRKKLRAALHGIVCSPSLVLRFLARSANQAVPPNSSRRGPTGADRLAPTNQPVRPPQTPPVVIAFL